VLAARQIGCEPTRLGDIPGHPDEAFLMTCGITTHMAGDPKVMDAAVTPNNAKFRVELLF
jgi:hypothetical protein